MSVHVMFLIKIRTADLFTLEKILAFRAALDEHEKLMRLFCARGTNSHTLPAGMDTACFSVKEKACKRFTIG